ncbi:MAG: mechanosensitive ion channel family protein [Candidatus Hydrogenedentota bacterium]
MVLKKVVMIWLIFFIIVFILLCAFQIILRIVVKKLSEVSKKTRTDVDDLIVELLGKTKFVSLLFVSLYIASFILNLSDRVRRLTNGVIIIVLLLQVAFYVNAIINYWITKYKTKKRDEGAMDGTTITAIGYISRMILWVVILLLVLENAGIDITALVAGLGIGGIAVALAVQNILGDIFSSLSIILDKPFVIGDFIVVGDYLGTVEHIGLKTTRIRSLSGEQLVFSNTDLLNSRIRNYKRMAERRVVFKFGVIYQTPLEKLKKIPSILKGIITAINDTRFDRTHFVSFGDSSLDFEVVYYVLKPDYNVYMDIQQAINLALYKEFKEEGIEFAYPTQTIYIEKTDLPC